VPLYEYQCKKCKHRFEKIQKFSDRAVKKCPQCGGPVEKLLSASAVRFKGSGWYVTDYARKGSGSSESGAAPDTAKTDGAKSGASTSTKSADKTDKAESKKTDKKHSAK
jgi:putative FmdB family regulatory protein